MRRFSLIAALCVSALVSTGTVLYWYTNGRTIWASLDAGSGRSVRVLVDRATDSPGLGVYVEFLHDDEVVAPLHFIGTDLGLQPPFILVPANDPNLVAIATKERPKSILAVFDYQNGLRWPGGFGWQRETEVAGMLLSRMRDTDRDYRLSGWTFAE